MANSFDSSVINPIITDFVEQLITTKGGLVSSKPFEVATKPIVEYEGHMMVKATDKFDVAVYLAASSFYLNQADMKARKARGALVVYLDTEVADKVFKAAGFQVPYDEDDESMLALGGSLCQMIAEAIKERLAAAGYPSLEFSTPATYKNTISGGVEFSKEQTEKQELSFYFLKHKAVVVEWTMAPIPKK